MIYFIEERTFALFLIYYYRGIGLRLQINGTELIVCAVQSSIW